MSQPPTNDLIDTFIRFWQDEIIDPHYRAAFRIVPPPRLSAMHGRRYARLVATSDRGGRTCYGFIDLETGAILKGASWDRPFRSETHPEHDARGWLDDASTWPRAVGPFGVVYLEDLRD